MTYNYTLGSTISNTKMGTRKRFSYSECVQYAQLVYQYREIGLSAGEQTTFHIIDINNLLQKRLSVRLFSSIY